MYPLLQDPQCRLESFAGSFSQYRKAVIDGLQEKFPNVPSDTFEAIGRCIDYNIPHGKLNRGHLVLETVAAMTPVLSEELYKDAECLAWCVEWLQGYFLMADDVMDASELRRGRPCWYRCPGIGLGAINDALILRSCIDILLKQRFLSAHANDQRYYALKDLFVEIELATQLGQLLDWTTSGDFLKRVESGEMSPAALMDRYFQLIEHKTALYSFYLPFAAAQLLHQHVPSLEERTILLNIGRLFQVQDDVLDVFGDPSVMGKIGTDIEESKCTWPLCTVLMERELRAEDLKLLFANYGRRSDQQQANRTIRSLYTQYRVEDRFAAFEESARAKIEHQIAALPRPSSRAALTSILSKIIKRIK
jgi:farnesyl diphosphate synthase